MTRKKKINPFDPSNWNVGDIFGSTTKKSKPMIPKRMIPEIKPIRYDNSLGKAMRQAEKQSERFYKKLERDMQNTKIGISTSKLSSTAKKTFYTYPSLIKERQSSNYNTLYGIKQPSIPTLMDILKEIDQRRAEKERREHIRKIRMQEFAQKAIAQEMTNSLMIGQNATNYTLRKQISNLNEKVNENTDKIEKISDGLDSIKERLDDLESYKKSLESGITNLIKRQEIEPNNPAVITALNNVMDEKKKTEDEIMQIKTTLENVVGQLEKDAPFTQSMKRIYDDKRFNQDV